MAEPLASRKLEAVDIPENSFTMVLRVNGKFYTVGGKVGEKMNDDIPDEDLDSTLRAINNASISVQRTLAVKVCGKPLEYEVPGDKSVEQEVNSAVKIMKADEDIKKGDPVVVDEELQRARNATPDELGIENADEPLKG